EREPRVLDVAVLVHARGELLELGVAHREDVEVDLLGALVLGDHALARSAAVIDRERVGLDDVVRHSEPPRAFPVNQGTLSSLRTLTQRRKDAETQKSEERLRFLLLLFCASASLRLCVEFWERG